IPMVITDGLSSRGWWSATGSLTSGRHTPLLSHVAAGAGRVRQAVSEPTRQGGKEPASQSTGTLDATGCRPHVLTAIQQVRAPPSERLTSSSTVGGDLGKRRVAQRFPAVCRLG